MANVTLIGEKLAREGLEFVYFGPMPECKDCKVKTVCFNLVEGRAYRVVGLRSMRHECKLHDGNVVAIEYEPLPVEAVVDPRQAIEGSSQRIPKTACTARLCSHFRSCTGGSINRDVTYKISKVIGDADCRLDRRYKLVIIEEEAPVV